MITAGEPALCVSVRKTDRPSSPGIIISSTTRSQGDQPSRVRKPPAVHRFGTKTVAEQKLDEQFTQRGIIVDDDDPGAFVPTPFAAGMVLSGRTE